MKKIRNIIISLFLIFNLLLITGCKKTYSITYNLDGGVLENKIAKFTKQDMFKLNTPYKEGYIFEGWYLDFDCQGSSIDEISGDIKKDITLYAKWSLIEYTVTFDSNGGNDIENQKIPFNKNVVKPNNPIRDGYKFNGWYLNGEEYDFTKEVTSDITLVANWEKEIVKYIITYVNQGIKEEKVVEENTILEKPNDPVRDGYKFSGWYLNGEEYDFTKEVTSDITLVANWEKFYAIKFLNAELDDILFSKNDEITLPIPTKENYIFKGWFTSYAYEGEPIEVIEIGTSKNLTLIAKWARGYKINYNLNDGVMPEEYQNYYEYESEYILPIPTKNGYKFKGWTENPNSSYITYMVCIPLIYEEEITLTAIWEKETYSVEYIFGQYLFADYKQLYRAFFSDFYYYIKDYRYQEEKLIKSGANNVEDFLEICSTYTGGSAGMSQIGNNYGSFYLKIDTGGKIEDQHSDDGFIGYCLDNNMYVEFIYFIQEFFYYWRLEEGYTNSSSDPNGTGSDFLASAWASLIDTAKFFYYSPYVEQGNPHRLPSYFFREGYKVPTFYERIPYIVDMSEIELVYTYDWEEEIILPTNINYEGYIFLGWYDNPEFEGDALIKIDAGIYHNIKIYAKFEKIE